MDADRLPAPAAPPTAPPTGSSPNSINVSVIAPAAYLRDFVSQSPPTVHHVAAQRVLQDPAYRAFFAHEAALGACIVLDNGVFDLGHALEPEQLVRAARLVSAREIILPDVIRDGPATMKATDEAARRVLDLSDEFRLAAVVHGSDDAQWLRCYDHFVSDPNIATITLPASRLAVAGREISKNRVAATGHLADRGMIEPRVTYRLLGLGRTGHLELFHQRQHDWIASVDCAAPVILGAMGVPMLPSGPYAKIPTLRVDALGPIDPARFRLIRDNIAAVRHAANCPLLLPEEP